MQSDQRPNEIRPARMEEQWNFYICCAGELLFMMSLLLPGMGKPPGDVIPGFMCLLIGFYWYPSNLALMLSPMICTSANAGLRTFMGNFLLISCFSAFLIVSTNGMQEPRVGFWLWLSALVVSGLGLLTPVRSTANRSEWQ